MREKNIVIVLDFDGTITIEDSNDLLFKILGNTKNEQIETEFLASRMSNRKAMRQHFEEMLIGMEDYHSFLDAHIRIDSTFDAFLEEARSRNILPYIVSGGFRQAIERVLGKKRLDGIEVLANDLVGDKHITTSFATAKPLCDKAFGPCGNCKRDVMKKIRRERPNRTIVFVGDGLTDRCAMEGADVLYAKNSLAEYCGKRDLPYVLYANFADIADHLWGSEVGNE